LMDDASVPLVRLGCDLCLDVIQPTLKERSECGLARLEVTPGLNGGYQPGAFDLRLPLRTLEGMPLPTALAGQRVGNVEDDCPMARAAFADVALHWLLPSLMSAEMRKWWTLSAKIFLLSGLAAHSGLLPMPKIMSRSN
jgi:hypothetical protein